VFKQRGLQFKKCKYKIYSNFETGLTYQSSLGLQSKFLLNSTHVFFSKLIILTYGMVFRKTVMILIYKLQDTDAVTSVL
jgi:hypothetical protein